MRRDRTRSWSLWTDAARTLSEATGGVADVVVLDGRAGIEVSLPAGRMLLATCDGSLDGDSPVRWLLRVVENADGDRRTLGSRTGTWLVDLLDALATDLETSAGIACSRERRTGSPSRWGRGEPARSRGRCLLR